MKTKERVFLKTERRTAILGVLLWLCVLKVSAASFQPLGDLGGGIFFSLATSVSANGSVVCGYSSSTNSGASSFEAFRWTATNGMVALGDLPGGTYTSFAKAISADGSTVVGFSSSSSGDEAFRWTQTGIIGLGDLPGGLTTSSAYGVSAAGDVVVGFSSSTASGTRSEAFRWTAATQMVGLGDLPGGNYDSRAWGVSGDGTVIVGESSSASGNEAFRWTAAGMVGLGDLAGGSFNSIAYGISTDGSTITGYGLPPSNVHEAFRWKTNGMSGLGALPCDTWSIGRAVSGNGAVIVGDPQSSSCRCVFIWDAQHGMRDLLNVLTNGWGLNLQGWQLCRATALSFDGNVIVGYGINPSGQTEAWLANIAPPVLGVRRDGGNVVLSWPTNAPGFLLQSTGSLPSANWINSTNVPGIVGTEFAVTNAALSNAQFYRLRR